MNDYENKNPYQDENGNLSGNQDVNQSESSNQNGYQNPYQSGSGNQNGYQNPYQSGSDNQNGYQNPYQSGSGNSGSYQSPYQNRNPGGYSNDYNTYYNEVPRKNGKGLAIASMVLGILSITVCCCIPVINLIFAIVALVLGIISQKNNPNGMALAGIITAAFGLIFGVIINISFFSELIDILKSGSMDGSFFEDSSSFNNNNNAIIGLFNLIKRVIGL